MTCFRPLSANLTGPILGLFVALMSAQIASASVLIDRGLPDINLNNPAGGDRSNVAWGFGNNDRFFSGDDFTLGSGLWEVDSLTVWTVAGAPDDSDFQLGDRFESVTLYGGPSSGSIASLQSGNFSVDQNNTDNPNILISKVQYANPDGNGESDYQTSSGVLAQLWEVTFSNLNWIVQGGVEHKFGVHGIANAANPDRVWFNHASNAALSGTPQQGSDNLYRWFDINDLSGGGFIDSNGNGWDKSSDVNVLVQGAVVPEPASVTMVAGGLGFGLLVAVRARRRRTLRQS